MSYEPLHHKYRPQTFAHLVGQEAIAQTLVNAIRTQRIAPAYLFTGPRGTGKTSSARILAKSLNCLKQDQPTESPCGVCDVCKTIASGTALDVIEIDAASNTGVDNIRDLIEKAQFAPVQCRYKVYVVDECHMLSTAAFNALLKTLEEPPKHVVFVLATTDPQRVLPTIISRCQRFDFRRIPLQAMVQHLQDIAFQENINITPDALTLVAQVAQGGLRDAESLLDQLGLLSGQVTVEAVWDLVGVVPERDLMTLTQAIDSNNSEAVLDNCRHLLDRGREPIVVLQNLASFYRDLLIAKTAPNRNDLVAVTLPTWQQMLEFAGSVDISWILQGQQHLKNSEAQIKNSTQPRLWLEVTLLGLLPSAICANVVNQAPINPPAVRRQESQTPREPSPSVAPRHSASHPAPPPSPPVQTRAPDQPASSTSASNPQPSHSPSPTLGVKASPTSVQPPISQAPTESPTNSEKPVDGDAEITTQETISPNTTSETVVTSPLNIEEIWQNVLLAVRPYTTQTLLRQHCHLISFEGSIAYVGVSSLPLLELAQKKLPNIEAAFKVVYKSKIKVTLQTKAVKSSNTAAVNQAVHPVVLEPTPQTVVTQPITNDSSSQRARQVQAVLNQEDQGTKVYAKTGRDGESTAVLEKYSPRNHPTKDDVLTETSIPVPFTESLEVFSLKEIDVDGKEIEKALVDLKQFFEGDIVDLSEELSNPQLTSIQSVKSEEEMNDDTEVLEVEQAEDKDELSVIKLVETQKLEASELAALQNVEIQQRLEYIEYDENGDMTF